MRKIFLALLFLPIISSCVYYKGMPSAWEKEVATISDCQSFSGFYRLSSDNESLSNGRDYNDLRYFQNTQIYGHGRVLLEDLDEIKIDAGETEINITFYRRNEAIHKTTFNKESYECNKSSLLLALENQSAGGGLAAAYILPSITMYKASTDGIFVKYKEN